LNLICRKGFEYLVRTQLCFCFWRACYHLSL
jgi:hypothetical protein